MENKVSISSIAKELGISPTTVSFVLNGQGKEKRISEKLALQVTELAEKLGYRPNSLARSFRTGRTNIIGLLVEDMSNAFFSTIARLIEEKSYQNGYKIIYSSTENDTAKTKELLAMYAQWHVDGYILVPPQGVEDDINMLIESGKPVVQLDRYLSAAKTDAVTINNLQSACQATAHLIDCGFKNIALVTIASSQHQMNDRLLGYEKALSEAGYPGHILRVNKAASPEEQMISFFREKKEIDAVFFATNYLCVSGLRSIKRLGLDIPGDIGVVSFDDHELFELYSPSLTAVAQPLEQLAQSTIDILLNRLKSRQPSGDFNRIVLEASFIIRNSSQR